MHRFVDTCAVYVLTSGNRALLVDFGAGEVLERLDELGVDGIDWVLHTHHHRDQCQGDRLLPQSVSIVLWRVVGAGFSDIWDEPVPPLESRIEEVSDHLLTVRATVAHFHVLHVDGKALFFDFGFGRFEHFQAGFRFVEHSLAELRERYGIEDVEVVVPTHYHDDHVCGIPFLQSRFGSEVWAYDGFAHLLERPKAYRVPCLYSEPISVTRRVRDGEEIH
ncbi:MAG: MBL fold metallo-hydrolase [Gaiellaceae bacterium]